MKISEHYSSQGSFQGNRPSQLVKGRIEDLNSSAPKVSEASIEQINQAAIYFSKMTNENYDQIEEADKLLVEMRRYLEESSTVGLVEITESIQFNSDRITKLFV